MPRVAVMSGKKYVISLALLWGIAWLSLMSNLVHSTDFTTNFEATNFNTIQSFSVTNNGLSVLFSGGTSFTIGNGLLYHSGTKSWMIDPAGTTSRGVSDGIGTFTFSEGAMALDFFIRTSNAASTGQVQIKDSTGAVIEDITSTITSSSWLHVEKTLTQGDALMTSVVVSAFGSNMLAVDDLSFSTATTVVDDSTDDDSDDPAPDDMEEMADDEPQSDSGGIYGTGSSSESSSSGGALYWLSLLLTGFLIARKPS